MKHFILASLVGFSGGAFANISCGGYADRQTFVTVNITTEGVTAKAVAGEVVIEKGGNAYGYRFKSDVINQYFEHSQSTNNSMMAGVFASPSTDGPLELRYVGSNYVDMDLKAVIQQGPPQDQGNIMHVWQGPGSTDQFEISNFVCKKWNSL